MKKIGGELGPKLEEGVNCSSCLCFYIATLVASWLACFCLLVAWFVGCLLGWLAACLVVYLLACSCSFESIHNP